MGQPQAPFSASITAKQTLLTPPAKLTLNPEHELAHIAFNRVSLVSPLSMISVKPRLLSMRIPVYLIRFDLVGSRGNCRFLS